MSDYSKTTNFTAKDALATGNPNKKILGSLFDTEFDAIETAVATKANLASPTFTGTVTLPGVEIQDTSADHQYVFAVNELTADRTITLPLLTGNDTFVFNDFTATLTNKTIDSASNTLTLDLSEGTLTGTAAEFDTACSDDNFAYQTDLGSLAALNTVNNSNWSGTDLSVANGGTGSSSASAARTALDVQQTLSGLAISAATISSTDKVLIQDANDSDNLKTVTTQAIADLSGSPGMIYLAKDTLSSDASSIFNNTVLDGTYEEYVIHLKNVILVTEGAELYFFASTDNGTTYITSYSGRVQNAGTAQSPGTTETSLTGTAVIGSDTNEVGFSGVLHLINPGAAAYTQLHWVGVYQDTNGAGQSVQGGTVVQDTGDVDAIKFEASSGNLESGEIVVYGLRNA